jgi:hypothetical protein
MAPAEDTAHPILSRAGPMIPDPEEYDSHNDTTAVDIERRYG